MDLKNLSIVRRSFANTVFTHKVHEIAVEFQERKLLCVKIINIILVSIVLIILFSQILYPGKIWLSYLGAGLSVIEVIFLIIQLAFGFDKRMILHKNIALKFMGLRDSYISLISDIMNENINIASLITKRDSLQREYQIICELAPQTGRKEYHEAQIRLNKKGRTDGEEFTWLDEEIDHFLPESLRLK